MGEQYTELSALLRKIRARWRAMTALRAWSWAAAAAAAVLLLALVAHGIAQPEGRVLVALWAVAALAALVALAWIVGPLRRAPAGGQVARFVEACRPFATARGMSGARREWRRTRTPTRSASHSSASSRDSSTPSRPRQQPRASTTSR